MNKFFQLLALGPFFYLRQRWKFSMGLLLIIGILTMITQIGGIILWASLPVLDCIHLRGTFMRMGVKLMFFILLYGFSLLVLIPPLASLGGRVPLPWFADAELPLRPVSIGYCLLARNYVTPAMRSVLERTAKRLSATFPGSTVLYLDGNFPFFKRFPLLPHLSHHNGKKLDLAYFYCNATNHEPRHDTPSPIGYWAYEQPEADEIQPCRGVKSWLRWDFAWLQPQFVFAEIDLERTSWLMSELIAAPEMQKILIEPHLKQRLHADSTKVRFQGCRAARHDDHIHLQTY